MPKPYFATRHPDYVWEKSFRDKSIPPDYEVQRGASRNGVFSMNENAFVQSDRCFTFETTFHNLN